MKVLLLCHGRRHKYPTHKPRHALCGTSGLTLDTLERSRLVTLDINKRARPHMNCDITKPIHSRHKFDVISNMYAPYFIFINYCTGNFMRNTFVNMQNMLKHGGYAVFAIADEGIDVIMHKYKLLTRSARRRFHRYLTVDDEYQDRSKFQFIRRNVSKFIGRRICREFPEFQIVEGQEKQKLLMRWNRSANPLDDDHNLIVIQHRLSDC